MTNILLKHLLKKLKFILQNIPYLISKPTGVYKSSNFFFKCEHWHRMIDHIDYDNLSARWKIVWDCQTA